MVRLSFLAASFLLSASAQAGVVHDDVSANFYQLKQRSSVVTPSSGYLRLFSKTDNNLYVTDSTGGAAAVVLKPTNVTASSNGVVVTPSSTGVTIANSQDLRSSASPTFAGVTLSSLSQGLVSSSSAGAVGSVATLPLGVFNGGTGQTSANSALNALLPSQGSNSGKVLQTDGSNTSWVTASSGSPTPYVFHAYHHGPTCNWARTNTAYGDGIADASCTFILRQNTNSFISAYGSANNGAGGTFPGIVVTPSQGGLAKICAYPQSWNGTASQEAAYQLATNGLVPIAEGAVYSTATTIFPLTLCGYATVTASTSVSFSIRMKAGSGAANIQSGGATPESVIEWNMELIK